jgi:AcrR family transcriptional regulator/8-oxo-dGTP pyrophosphatase MutT (NUDIX family)
MSAAVIAYAVAMSRWQPDARVRLGSAAMELFAECGYDGTTVAQIAERAGLTERTFFRHFTDKQEVLFAGGHPLEDAVVDAVAAAPADAAPFEALAQAMTHATAAFFADRYAFAQQRQAIIDAHPGLQERELLKMDSLARGVAAGLVARGTPDAEARLAAQAGVGAFHVAFGQWIASDGSRELADLVREAFNAMAIVTGGARVATPAPSTELPSPSFVVSAVVLRDASGRILTVRKAGTRRFMLPGGKPEPSETAAQAAIRECAEELGLTLDPDRLTALGVFKADAANEPGLTLEGSVFEHPLEGEPRAGAEIAELRWLDPSQPLPSDLAPLLEHHVLPLLESRHPALHAEGAP